MLAKPIQETLFLFLRSSDPLGREQASGQDVGSEASNSSQVEKVLTFLQR
jgi:hypothetical protein